MSLLYVKSIHIVFVVTWFAGLFYIVRLFIYDVEAEKKPDELRVAFQQEFRQMQKRLWYGITWPSAIVTLVTGIWLVWSFRYWTQPWMQIKLLFVLGLFVYHLICGHILRQIKRGEVRYSSTKLRVWNEIASLFLVAIVFLVVLKNTISFLWGIVGLVVLAALLMAGIQVYKRIRTKHSHS